MANDPAPRPASRAWDLLPALVLGLLLVSQNLVIPWGRGADPAGPPAGAALDGAGLARPGGRSDLRRLDLSPSRVTDAGLSRLAGATGPQTLDLFGTRVTDDGLRHPAGLTGLRGLYPPRGLRLTPRGPRP
jgi:hypothetical protein